MNLQNYKLYIILRKDLTPGAKLAQSCHAALCFREEHEEISKQWLKESNYICILEVNSEQDLIDLLEISKKHNIASSLFKEPDLNNSLTAIALEPGLISKKICSKLPLALRNL